MDRSSGILLHVSSLPGPFGIGDLGPTAHRWIDMLAGAGQRWWQILPLAWAAEGNSPYRAFSAFAGNPLLISPQLLADAGLVTRSQLRAAICGPGDVDYPRVIDTKLRLLRSAYQRFKTGHAPGLKSAYRRFVLSETAWLDDFALYMALREAHAQQAWTEWPTALSRREPTALSSAAFEHHESIDFYRFIQFIFFRQLAALRKYARSTGVGIIGDLPIFVSDESADVWTNRRLFQLRPDGRPRAVAGVPPDMFSSTGQRWGNPLYNWKALAKEDFAWWKSRLRAALRQADIIRLDHFRGFESYWAIPTERPTAVHGVWTKAPGQKFFASLLRDLPTLPLIAEDLGTITPAVDVLRDGFGLPGMRVLQFGFTSDPVNPHTPHNFIRRCVAYTATHDNDTTTTWYADLPAAAKRRLHQYAPHLPWKSDPAGSLLRILWSSTADCAIAPLQDLLRLTNRARMNRPGQPAGNWQWRLPRLSDCHSSLKSLKELTETYGRNRLS